MTAQENRIPAAMPITDRLDATVGGNRRVAFETVYRGEVAR